MPSGKNAIVTYHAQRKKGVIPFFGNKYKKNGQRGNIGIIFSAHRIHKGPSKTNRKP